MIFSAIEPTAWDSQNAHELRDFLESKTGILALQWTAYRGPELLDGADVNKTLVASGEVKGYSSAIENLFSLTKIQPEEVKPPETYPNLDDDSKWGDLQPTTPKKS